MNTARIESLRLISQRSHHALELGKAAEHLVCADLILSGYRCYLSDQGLPYDVIVDVDGHLYRIQVKASSFTTTIYGGGKRYRFGIRRIGKNGKKLLRDEECDFVALVALDINEIAYLPLSFASRTTSFLPPNSHSKLAVRYIDRFPFKSALQSLQEQRHDEFAGRGRLIEWKGESRTITEWSKLIGISVNLIKQRLLNGWNIDRVFERPKETRFLKNNVLAHELPSSRAFAKENGITRYFTGKPCKHGHISPRCSANGQCIACDSRTFIRPSAP